MEWKEYPLHKPENTGYCYTNNKKRGTHTWLAFYSKSYDHFTIDDIGIIPLEVTHFIELPFPPVDNIQEKNERLQRLCDSNFPDRIHK